MSSYQSGKFNFSMAILQEHPPYSFQVIDCKQAILTSGPDLLLLVKIRVCWKVFEPSELYNPQAIFN
jgi:hypothetical protein